MTHILMDYVSAFNEPKSCSMRTGVMCVYAVALANTETKILENAMAMAMFNEKDDGDKAE